MVKVKLLESQQPSGLKHTPSEARLLRRCRNRAKVRLSSKVFLLQAVVNETTKVASGTPKSCYYVSCDENVGSPKGCEPYGDGVVVVVRGRESRPHGEGRQVTTMSRLGGARDA
jgi:hypothetical protein